MRFGFPSAHVCSHFAEEGLRYHQVNAVGRDAIAEVQAHFASTSRSVEGKLQPRAVHAWIAEVSAGKGITKVIDEGVIGQVLNIKFRADYDALAVQQVHAARPAKNVPGLHPLRGKVHQVGAG